MSVLCSVAPPEVPTRIGAWAAATQVGMTTAPRVERIARVAAVDKIEPPGSGDDALGRRLEW
jgi:hypothetical protein